MATKTKTQTKIRTKGKAVAQPGAFDPQAFVNQQNRALAKLAFAAPVTHVLNPLTYAGAIHAAYLERYATQHRPRPVLFVGMNPGPWGMAQTGVPFGEVTIARDWLQLAGPVAQPAKPHPKRPITGFDCPRSEVSGARFWGWAKARFGTPEAFFEHCFVANYCPLVFTTETGRNHTPDKLPAAERDALFSICDKALLQLVFHLRPAWVVGVGAFAEARVREATVAANGVSGENATAGSRAAGGQLAWPADYPVPKIGRVLHPSPASPAANRGWAPQAEKNLQDLGILLPYAAEGSAVASAASAASAASKPAAEAAAAAPKVSANKASRKRPSRSRPQTAKSAR